MIICSLFKGIFHCQEARGSILAFCVTEKAKPPLASALQGRPGQDDVGQAASRQLAPTAAESTVRSHAPTEGDQEVSGIQV